MDKKDNSVISANFDGFWRFCGWAAPQPRTRRGDENIRMPMGMASPQSACFAGKRSRSATSSTSWRLGGHDFRFQIWYFKMIKVLFRPVSMDSGVFAAGQRSNCGPGAGTETFACRWAWHRHKVPALQADGVAARLRPPPATRAGCGERSRCNHFPPDPGCHGSSALQEEYGRVRANRVVSG